MVIIHVQRLFAATLRSGPTLKLGEIYETLENPRTKLLFSPTNTKYTINNICNSSSPVEFSRQVLRKTISNAGKSIPKGLVVPAAPIFSFRSVEIRGIEVK
jgi:hypothetical protein